MICPVCSNNSFSTWGRVNTYEIEQCLGCGLGITSPFPEPGELVAINQETYLLGQRINIYLSRCGYFKKRYRRQLRDINFFKSGGRLLDIGCNIGLFLNEARAAGFDTTGVELNSECAEYARTNFELRVYSDYINNISFEEGFFDVVTMYDVLEHIPDPQSILNDIRSILKPDGLLVIQSPNLDSLMAGISRSSWSWLCPPDHLFHFTPGSLCSLIEQSGYSILKFKTWEPADAFCDDIMHAMHVNFMLARIAYKLTQQSGLALALVTLLQRIWWAMKKGALIEVYASKVRNYPYRTESKPDKSPTNDL
jgi:SAM-dependent methyltransferase